MTNDLESVTLRPTVIDGQRQEDDFEGDLARPSDWPDHEAAYRAALVVDMQRLRTTARS
jgi:hypothetical protein